MKEKLARKFLRHIKKNRKSYCLLALVTMKIFIYVSPAYAAVDIYKSFKMISLMQSLVYVSSIVSGFWSIMQWQLGNPSWKDKMAAAIGGFAFAMLLPSLFDAIKATLK